MNSFNQGDKVSLNKTFVHAVGGWWETISYGIVEKQVFLTVPKVLVSFYLKDDFLLIKEYIHPANLTLIERKEKEFNHPLTKLFK